MNRAITHGSVFILGIDPGTRCGWALRKPDGLYLSGVWDLKGDRFEGAGMRLVRLERYLWEIFHASTIDQIYFEEVRFHAGVDAAHAYGGIVGKICEWAENNRVPYRGIPVGTIKKFATGKGNANKKLMLAAAESKWSETTFADDNEADARWIAECAASGKL